MAIKRMVSNEQKGKPGIETSIFDGHEIHMETTHVGLVLEIRERNGYHDSDFYAVVWNRELQKPEQIEYATTRSWTYPNTAWVDATDEVKAEFKAWQEKIRQDSERAYQNELAKMPKIGQLVKVVKGRKVAKGTQGEIFWVGKDNYKEARSRRYSTGLEGLLPFRYYADQYRVGLRLSNGSRVFVSAENIEFLEVA